MFGHDSIVGSRATFDSLMHFEKVFLLKSYIYGIFAISQNRYHLLI